MADIMSKSSKELCGDWLALRRAFSHVTLDAQEQAIGIPASTIDRIEDGKGVPADLDELDIRRWTEDIFHYMPRSGVEWRELEIAAVIRGALTGEITEELRAKVEAYLAA
jgi:hypothetical protein